MKPTGKDAASQWWSVLSLIAGLDATPTQKYLLDLILRHTNSKKGYAWAEQRTLAVEMCVSVPTVERAFAWGKKLGIVIVREVRTGPKTQHNEYWLSIERLKELQRLPEQPPSVQGASDDHPSPMMAHSSNDDPSSVMGQDAHDPSSVKSMTHHLESDGPSFDAGWAITHDGEGFDLKHLKSTSSKDTSRERDSAAQAATVGKGSLSLSGIGELHLCGFAEKLKSSLRCVLGKPGSMLERNLHVVREDYKEQAIALGMRMRDFGELYIEVTAEARKELDAERSELEALDAMLTWVCDEKTRLGGWNDSNVMFTAEYWESFKAKSIELGLPVPAA
ncbi:MAG TPA: hypothetical protein VGI46_06880 [Candidatus Acidoferrum sp.]|jgi:hypothetical protein